MTKDKTPATVGVDEGFRPAIDQEAWLLARLVIPPAVIFADAPEHVADLQRRAAAHLEPWVLALRAYRQAQGRMLAKWADGDENVKRRLWQDLHACEALADLADTPSPPCTDSRGSDADAHSPSGSDDPLPTTKSTTGRQESECS